MRIHSISFRNLHSIRQKVDLDFEGGPLAQAGIFAITGPTGAGKSTIFDAVSLALFGRVARFGSATPSEVISEGEASAEASVVFSVDANKQDRYRASWGISRNRNNKLNTPTHKLFHELNQVYLAEKTSATTEQVEELTGMKVEQFHRAVLLAQGDFAALLKAKTSERTELLAKLTGTEIYADLSKACHEKMKQLKQEVEVNEAELSGIALLSEEERAAKVLELQALEAQIPKTAGLVGRQRQLVALGHRAKENSNAKQQTASILVKVAGLLPEQKNAVGAAGTKFEAAQRLLQDKGAELQEARKLDVLQKQSEKVLQERNAESEFAKKEHVAAQEASKAAEEALSKHEKRLVDGRGYMDERKEFAQAGERASALELLVTAVELASSNKKTLEGEIQQVVTLTQQTEVIRQSLQKLQTEQDSLNSNLVGLRTAEQQALTYSEDAKRLRELAATIRGLSDHRSELRPGQECPLCGALEHPLADKTSAAVESEFQKATDTALAAEKRHQQAVAAVQKASLELGSKKATAEEQNRQLVEKQKALADVIGGEPSGSWLVNKQADLATLSKASETQLGELQAKIQSTGKVDAKAAITLLKAKQSEYDNGIKLLAQLEQTTSGLVERKTASLEALEQKLVQLNKAHQSSETAKAEHQKHVEARRRVLGGRVADDVQKELEKEVSLAGKNLDSAKLSLQKLLDEETTTKGSLETLATQRGKLIADASLLNEDLAKVEAELPSLEQTLVHGEEEATRQNTQHAELKTRLDMDLKNREQLQQKTQALASLKVRCSEWQMLNSLIGSSDGKKFAQFAQTLTLEVLLGLANEHLREFAPRYSLNQSSDGKLEFKVVDHQLGDALRSIESLSGGETFLVSLALALGVSGLVSQAKSIRTLFVDEGFGALDPETLDTALEALDKLRSQGRIIGIISHIPQVKERIATQIIVERGADQWSRVTISA